MSIDFVLLLQEVGAKHERLDFEQFHKLYNLIMFEQNEVGKIINGSFFVLLCSKFMQCFVFVFT